MIVFLIIILLIYEKYRKQNSHKGLSNKTVYIKSRCNKQELSPSSILMSQSKSILSIKPKCLLIILSSVMLNRIMVFCLGAKRQHLEHGHGSGDHTDGGNTGTDLLGCATVCDNNCWAGGDWGHGADNSSGDNVGSGNGSCNNLGNGNDDSGCCTAWAAWASGAEGDHCNGWGGSGGATAASEGQGLGECLGGETSRADVDELGGDDGLEDNVDGDDDLLVEGDDDVGGDDGTAVDGALLDVQLTTASLGVVTWASKVAERVRVLHSGWCKGVATVALSAEESSISGS